MEEWGGGRFWGGGLGLLVEECGCGDGGKGGHAPKLSARFTASHKNNLTCSVRDVLS